MRGLFHSGHPIGVHRRFTAVLIAAALLGEGGEIAVAQGLCPAAWTQRLAAPPPRSRHLSTFNARTGRVTIFGDSPSYGDGDLWEWDGDRWHQAPGFRVYREGGLGYDTDRGVLILLEETYYDELMTWENDGSGWELRGTGGPIYHYYRSMTYDSLHRRTVLYEGATGTWTWDGAYWINQDTMPPGSGYRLTFDSRRGVTVFVGTYNSELVTWEWDGLRWRQAPAPYVRESPICFDSARGVTVLHGARRNSSNDMQTWEWDGEAWTQRLGPQPPPRRDHTICYDPERREVVLFAGEHTDSQAGKYNDTWAWDGEEWRMRDGEPRGRGSHGMAYDPSRRRTVLFGGGVRFGLWETWEHDGDRWRLHPVNTGPELRSGHGMLYHESIGQTFLFGGRRSAYLNDTWLWDGEIWTQLTPQSAPSPRYHPAMAYDSDRDVVVLFGGESNNTYFGDTWEFENGDWVYRSNTGPTPRDRSHMIYDPIRRKMVLFGGFNLTERELGDTWTWDGTQWRQLPLSGPVARLAGTFVWDDSQQVGLLVGGDSDKGSTRYPWIWDGYSWRELEIDGPRIAYAAMVYNSDMQSMLRYGGGQISGSAQTWQFQFEAPSRPGDVDCDCAVSAFDIDPFILALVDPESYAEEYPWCDIAFADVNGDGAADAADIEPFIEALLAGP